MTNTADALQSLANAAAMRAIKDATVLIFCIDITKKDYAEDLEILKKLGQTHSSAPTLFVAAKSDLTDNRKINRLVDLFKNSFVETSAKKNTGLVELKRVIEQNIIQRTSSSSESAGKTALTERHKMAVSEAAKNIENAIAEIQNGNEEIAAYVLRAALQDLSKLETEHIDEAILDNIFSKFCIGK
jgi:tRNA modification GTPase